MSKLTQAVASVLRKPFIRMSGSRFVQRLLEKNVRWSQYLMGIGAGAGVLVSGEQAVIRLLEKRLPPPYCILDVGANQGQFLGMTLDCLGQQNLSVHCFEPARQTFNLLAENANDPRARLNNVGLARQKGEAVLHYDAVGSGLASLTRRQLDHHHIRFDHSEIVALTTVDDYCRESGIERVHLLKLDIEGHEFDALQGARGMFERGAIDLVTFEFGGTHIDTRSFFRDFWYFLTEMRMKLFRIAPSGYLFPIEKYKESLEQFKAVNFAAVREDIAI